MTNYNLSASYSELSMFDNVSEMNKTTNNYLNSIHKTYQETFRKLTNYSVKTVGVSRLKMSTLAVLLNKSRRTIQRHINYLAEHGFISVFNQTKKNGIQAASVYVINTKDYRNHYLKSKNVTPGMSHREHLKNTTQSTDTPILYYGKGKKKAVKSLSVFKALSINTRKHIRRVKHQHRVNRHHAIKNARIRPHGVTNDFYKQLKPFYSDSEIDRLHKSTLKTLKQFNRLDDSERNEVTSVAIRSLLKAKQEYAKGLRPSPVNDDAAYLNRTIFYVAFNAQEHGTPHTYTDTTIWRDVFDMMKA